MFGSTCTLKYLKAFGIAKAPTATKLTKCHLHFTKELAFPLSNSHALCGEADKMGCRSQSRFETN